MEKQRVQESPKSSGRNYTLKWFDGGKLTFKQAILAKCFDCCGGYVDGLDDCGVKGCPLYPFMPYRGKCPSP